MHQNASKTVFSNVVRNFFINFKTQNLYFVMFCQAILEKKPWYKLLGKNLFKIMKLLNYKWFFMAVIHNN